MKLRKSLYLSVLFGLILTAGFSSCSSDDSDYVDYSGSKVVLPKTRGFILNEGSYNGNNSSLTAFNYVQDTICNKSLYLSQNGENIGDTGEDLITDGDNLYMLVYGSSYMVKMNGAGMKEASYKFTSDQGQPRKAVISGDYIYVTTYGGLVLKFTKDDLKYVASCKVANNPENIVSSAGKLYVICNGYGKLNLMCVIDEATFTKATDDITVCNNPQKMISDASGNIFIEGYDANYTGAIYSYDKANKTVTEIGAGTSMAIKDNVLYIANSVTNWTTYVTATSFYSYNILTGKTDTSSFLKDVPPALAKSSVYCMDINPYDGSFYVGTSDYVTNGVIYHFTSDGAYKVTFTSGGVSPSHIVFMR
ncbi:MAG TPA: hypothetical protein PLF38_01375 [Xylanibacter oryzae]|nr:hypothetical protein [Xylanibacter oryzae]